jgi:hypothetical protein
MPVCEELNFLNSVVLPLHPKNSKETMTIYNLSIKDFTMPD